MIQREFDPIMLLVEDQVREANRDKPVREVNRFEVKSSFKMGKSSKYFREHQGLQEKMVVASRKMKSEIFAIMCYATN